MVGEHKHPVILRVLSLGPVIFALGIAPAMAISSSERTADIPDSWLVLYNLNSPDSAAWAVWYRDQWGIPGDHLLGLDASLDEDLTNLNAVQSQVITPVRTYLADNPEIEETIMGIVLGYGLPGHYGSPPLVPGIGGYSVANALQDMHDDGVPPASQKEVNADCPHMEGDILPRDGRLTKARMATGKYMVTRIDGPTLDAAMALTNAAKVLSSPSNSLHGEYVMYDYHDPDFPPSSDEWYWLRAAVESPELADLPWMEFDLDGQTAPSVPWMDAFRFNIYKLYGWSEADFDSPEPGPGSRVLGFDFNSFGAVTVRSTINEGGLFVPNALAAGYAAAIGATGEPQCCVGPFPDTLLASLREGWTLGEAFYLANPYDDWMWTLVGDPLLVIPNWFDAVLEPIAATDTRGGDVNGDGVVNGLDIQSFVGVYTGVIDDPAAVAAADLSGDGQVDDDDAYMFFAPVLHGTYDWDVLKGTADANGDGRVDGADIDMFVHMLVFGTEDQPLRRRWGADMNKDDEITLDDVPSFINALLLALESISSVSERQ